MSETLSFADEIDKNKNTPELINPEIAHVETDASLLDVRLRGAYITSCELTSPSTGNRVAVLYSDADLQKPKLTASHPMVPAGPYDGIGGQHGFARWSDYHNFPMSSDLNFAGGKEVAVQAKRSDDGLSLTKRFDLYNDTLTSYTTIRSSVETPEKTSLGEHLYFALENGTLDGLTINGQSINELLGEGSQEALVDEEVDGTLYWPNDRPAIIEFPAGHRIRLSAAYAGESLYPLAYWIWKRPGSNSICFEPVIGIERLDGGDTSGLTIPPYGNAELVTSIELL